MHGEGEGAGGHSIRELPSTREKQEGWINIAASLPLGFVLPASQGLAVGLGPSAGYNLLIRAPSITCLPSTVSLPLPLSVAPRIPSQISYMHPNLCLRVSFWET